MSEQARVVVVGAGMSGLAAAWALRDRRDTEVLVLEAASAVGGKVRVSDVAGIPLDEGAETFLVRSGEISGLASDVGLAADLTEPRSSAASLAVGGALRPLPARTLLGVPSDLDALAGTGVLSEAALEQVRAEPDMPGESLTGDVSIGALVRSRLGDEVADRLVDPLLGGVYAGRADDLSLAATVPALAAGLRAGPSLVTAARRVFAAAPAGPAAAMFGGVRGGVGRLPVALAAALTKAGVRIELGAAVRELRRLDHGWLLVTGSVQDPRAVFADAVVLAVPAAAAAGLLRSVAPTAAAQLATVPYSSMALVTMVLPAGGAQPFGPGGLPPGSGVLVPVTEGRTVKAATWASAKWQWVADAAAGRPVLRASIGRHGEEAVLRRADDELVGLVLDELRRLLRPAGHDVADPVAHRVSRWDGGLPQYTVGHLDRVRQIRAALTELPGLAVAGAAYDGVGLPACVRSGRAAAATVAAGLADNG